MTALSPSLSLTSDLAVSHSNQLQAIMAGNRASAGSRVNSFKLCATFKSIWMYREADPRSHRRVLLGESAVGKSSLVLQFVKGQFDDYRESTVRRLAGAAIWPL